MSIAKVLKPHVLADAAILSSTAYETAPAAYNSGTTYGVGSKVSVAGTLGLITVYDSLRAFNVGNTPSSSPIWWRWFCELYAPYNSGTTYAKGHRVQDNAAHLIYESVVDSNVGSPLSDVNKWIKVGATNKFAAFDNVIGTATKQASPLQMVLNVGSTGGVGFAELQGRKLELWGRSGPGGPVVYQRELDLEGSVVESFYDWFFTDVEQLGDVVLTDLPAQYAFLELEIHLSASVGDVAMGVCKPGKVSEIGTTKLGPRAGILDFSKKERDVFGGVSVLERSYSKRASFQIVTERRSFNRIFRMLASIRATPCFFIGVEEIGFEPLLVYGFYRDFSIAVDYTSHHLCSIETEGLT